MKIHSPEGNIAAESRGLATAPKDLNGVKLGILDNTKPNAGLFMKQATKALQEKYGVELVKVEEKNAALAAPEDLIQGLSKEVQIVLTGAAD